MSATPARPTGREPVPLPFLVPRDPKLALAFLNGALAVIDAVNAHRSPLRHDVLLARQAILDREGGTVGLAD